MRTDRDGAQRELAGQQAEAERLRSQLADAEAAVRRLTQAGARRPPRPPRATARPCAAPRAQETARMTLPVLGHSESSRPGP